MTNSTSQVNQGSLPRRDLLLFPLISLSTALLLFAIVEGIALCVWPERAEDTCRAAGGKHKPNCVTYMKNIEGPFVEYRFNNCGYRTKEPCGPKPPGTLRVAVMGTSTAEGWNVPYDEAFAPVAAKKLTAILGHPVEFQNLGSPLQANTLDDKIPDVLALQPDAILLIAGPFDFESIDRYPRERVVPVNSSASTGKAAIGIREAWQATGRHVSLLVAQSRALAVIQHYILQNEQMMYDLYQHHATEDDPLQKTWSERFTHRFAVFDALLGRISEKLGAEHCPFFVVLVPNRIQAAMVSDGKELRGFDPNHLSAATATSATAHGMNFIDLLPQFERIPHAAGLYYPSDGHANASAHQLIADAIVRRLTDGSIPAFSKDHRPLVMQ